MTDTSISYCYDGTFAGLLCAVYHRFVHRHSEVDTLVAPDDELPLFTGNIEHIATHPEHAQRVWAGLFKRFSERGVATLVAAFMSGKAQNCVFRLICLAFSSSERVEADFRNPDLLAVRHYAAGLPREPRSRFRAHGFGCGVGHCVLL